ncbi:MAG: DUF4178 domain-containing protein [Bacteroidota bacterium]
MIWLVLGFLVVALIVVVTLMVRSASAKRSAAGGGVVDREVADLADLGPLDARRGDTVSVMGRGADFSDLDFTIDRINRYQQGSDQWDELSGVYRGERVFLEAWQDDGVKVCLTAGDAEVPWASVGLSEQDLVRLDEAGEPGSTISVDGASWVFDSSFEVMFFEDGRGAGEGCYVWEFLERDGPRSLTIEKWEGEPFEALVSEEIAPGDVRVFRS